MKKIPAGILVVYSIACCFAVFSYVISPIPKAEASVSTWIRAFSIQPANTTDFGSEAMKQNLREMKYAGANYVTLIIPYYQSNRQSTVMYPSWNTPSDSSLASAIAYAHSIGLKVMLKPHLETDYIEWRGNIDPIPDNRAAWFQSYSDMLAHYGAIAEANAVEDYCMGAELLHLSNPYYDPNNTANWKKAIASLRSIYSGKLTYSANWYGELDTIEFWPELDYIGISAYYDLSNAANSSPEELKKIWAAWRAHEIEPVQQRFNKQIVFTEIGYRSMNGSYQNPWDWSRSAPYNSTDQSNAYQALFSYWENVPWMNGVSLWRWEMDPDAGGQSDTGYTPQHKPVLQTIRQSWTSTGTSTHPIQPADFTSTVQLNSSSPRAGEPFTIDVTVTDTVGDAPAAITDIEMYDDETGQRVMQKFFEDQDFIAGNSKTYTVSFTPPSSQSAVTYRLDVGIFHTNWTSLYTWKNNAGSFTVAPTNGGTTTPSQPPAFTSTVSSDTADPVAEQEISLHIDVMNARGPGNKTVTDIEIYDNATNQRALQKFFENQSFASGASRSYTVTFTPHADVTYRVAVGNFSANWTSLYTWKNNTFSFSVSRGAGNQPATSTPPTATSTPPVATSTPPVGTSTPPHLEMRFPTLGSHLSGTVVFTGTVTNRNLSDYSMSWQVEGRKLNPMTDSNADYPHKEASVDVAAFNWKPAGSTYHIDFVAIEKSTGNAIWKGADVYVE